MTEKGLSSGMISRIVTSEKEEVKRLLEEKEYTLDDLNELREAERNGKDREEVLELMSQKRNNLKVRADLEDAEGEIEGLEEIIAKLERDENLDTEERDFDSLGQTELIEMLGMEAEDLKARLKEKNYHQKDLEQILDAEEKVKDRKAVKNLLEKQIKRKNLEKDAREAEKDLENLEKDVKDFEEHKELEELSKSLLESKENQEQPSDEKSEKNTDEVEEDEDTEELMEEVDEIAEDLEGSDGKDNSDEDSELEEKKEIVSSLDIDIDDDRIDAMSMEDVKELKHEKEKREKMISELSSEGLDEEDLEIASTSDLEKLYNQVFDDNKDEEEKSKEEIREEAEEDFQMLKGAGKGSSEEEKNTEDRKEEAQERIEDLKTSIREKFSRKDKGEMEDTSGINKSSVKEKLESYRGLDERESAVKTAHIMKGYLEYRLNIDREMTYAELAENLPSDEYKGMDVLSNFFKQMQEDEYTQNIRVDSMKEILDSSLEVVDQLEG